MKRRAKMLVSIIYFLFTWSFQTFARWMRMPAAGSFVVLYYHAIPAGSRQRFAKQLEMIARHSRVVPASFSGPEYREENLVAITFDDAFLSVAENAVPELAKHSMHSTIFVPTNAVGRHPGWEMETENLDRNEVVMTYEQLSGLNEQLVHLGSHTMNHPHLTQLTAADVDRELRDSKDALAKALDRSVDFLAFPYGDHDDGVVQACRAAGYKRVYSIVPRSADREGSDFVRGRVAADPNDSRLEFFLKINGAYGWLPVAARIRNRLRPAKRHEAGTQSTKELAG